MKLNVVFAEAKSVFNANLQENSVNFNSGFGNVQRVTEYVSGDLYDGEYSIVPRVEEQVLPTKDKVLTEDMTILEIPYYDVSNESGGSTVYIAKELDYGNQ